MQTKEVITNNDILLNFTTTQSSMVIINETLHIFGGKINDTHLSSKWYIGNISCLLSEYIRSSMISSTLTTVSTGKRKNPQRSMIIWLIVSILLTLLLIVVFILFQMKNSKQDTSKDDAERKARMMDIMDIPKEPIPSDVEHDIMDDRNPAGSVSVYNNHESRNKGSNSLAIPNNKGYNNDDIKEDIQNENETPGIKDYQVNAMENISYFIDNTNSEGKLASTHSITLK